MTPDEVRTKYLEFFRDRGHAVIPSASLVPENDPTTLFTGSGMQPLIPYLLGKDHPQGKRLTNSQKSFRSGDIEDVGDNRHTTFFEMLGNWSLGDYFKKEQLPWFFEFLTSEIGLDPSRLYTTVFAGDERNGIQKDTEAAQIWKELFAKKGIDASVVEIGSEENGYRNGMQNGRIFYYDAKKNWWSRSGAPDNMPAGEPGGPDSEVFYEFDHIKHDPRFGEYCHPNCDCGRFLEIGNSVFMQYVKQDDGSFALLPKQNVDFGGGLERIVMAKNNIADVIEVNHKPIIEHLEKISGKKYGSDSADVRAFRIVADHIKAAVFLIADGVNPSNTDQGYFVRRLIRRAVRYADTLGVEQSTFANIVLPVSEMYKNAYPEVMENAENIRAIVSEEEEKFRKTLKEGLKHFAKLDGVSITGKDAFDLYQTYGFPIEVTVELAKERNIKIDTDGFKNELKRHQDLSRAGSEKKFKGGLGDTSDQSLKYHTATHLLHQALRDVLGDAVEQRGSNITPERLRFDFSFGSKMSDEQKKAVEEIVNEQIRKSLPMNQISLPKEEALKTGAHHFFGEKYGDTVSVYFIGDSLESAYSKEFCGGPHVKNTGQLGHFKIVKEEAVSAGVRRIKAVLE